MKNSGFENFIHPSNLEKPKFRISGMLCLIILIVFLTFFALDMTTANAYLILAICILLIVAAIVRIISWNVYVNNRVRNYRKLLEDRELFQMMETDYQDAPLYWNRVAIGEKYLFVKGHSPVPYSQLESTEYDAEEERETTATTIPESLRLVVHIRNGSRFEITIPCPEKTYTTRDGWFLQHRDPVPLKVRIRNLPYAQVENMIQKRILNAVASTEKSIHEEQNIF